MNTKLISMLLLAFSWAPVALGQVVYSNEHVEVIQLQEKAYLLKENFQFTANCLVIEGENELLIIDTGFGEIAHALVEAVQFLGKPVKFIVNSHDHHDHVGANALFGPEVTLVGHRNCKNTFEKHGQEVKGVDSSYTFDFSGHLVFCMVYPGGHSPCDILIFIPDLKIAYLGDIYLSESFPLVIVNQGSKVETLVSHLNEIFQSLPDDTRLFPGHGKETDMEYLGGYIAMLEETIEVVKKKMKSGKSLKEIQESDVLTDWEGWGKFFPFITTNSWIEQIYLSYSN